MMMRTHGRMRERRHIYSPLIYAHVYRFSQSRVCIRFARFCKMSFHTQNALTRARKISKKDTLPAKKKSPSCDRHSFVVVRYVSICDTHARTRVFVSLFGINERAIAFILSSLARSARARSLRFHRSERVRKIIIFTLVLCARVLRAPKKKVHQNSRLRVVILLFL